MPQEQDDNRRVPPEAKKSALDNLLAGLVVALLSVNAGLSVSNSRDIRGLSNDLVVEIERGRSADGRIEDRKQYVERLESRLRALEEEYREQTQELQRLRFIVEGPGAHDSGWYSIP